MRLARAVAFRRQIFSPDFTFLKRRRNKGQFVFMNFSFFLTFTNLLAVIL